MFGWFSGLAVVLVLGMSAAFLVQTRQGLVESLDHELGARAAEIASSVEEAEDGDDADEPPQYTRDAARAFEVWTLPGPAQARRSASLADVPPLLTPDRLRAIESRRSRAVAGSVNVPHRGNLRVYAREFTPSHAGGVTRVVVTAESLAEIDDEMRELLASIAVTLAVALLLAGTGAWLAARHLTRPLRDIAAAASRVESGGEAAPIPGSGAGDEVDQLAATLERTFARLRESYDRQARFSADAAHELRTPVSVVLSQAEVALRRERAPEEYRETLQHVVGAAQRMQQTLEALLLIARGDAGDLVVRGGRADLADVARAAIESCADAARAKSIAVRLDAAEPAAVAGDARLLGILVRNLLANAIACSRDGGPVEVSVATSAAGVVLAVRDEGAGIPAEALPHVFERFYRVDDSRSRATGGCGLGLSLVRLVAELHGGSASAESELGKGTRITVRLPAPPAGAA
jgi:heavy metal sensor kinase